MARARLHTYVVRYRLGWYDNGKPRLRSRRVKAWNRVDATKRLQKLVPKAEWPQAKTTTGEWEYASVEKPKGKRFGIF